MDKELRDNKVLKVPKEYLEHKVLREHRELPVILVLKVVQETQVLKEQLEFRVRKVTKGLKGL